MHQDGAGPVEMIGRTHHGIFPYLPWTFADVGVIRVYTMPWINVWLICFGIIIPNEIYKTESEGSRLFIYTPNSAQCIVLKFTNGVNPQLAEPVQVDSAPSCRIAGRCKRLILFIKLSLNTGPG